MTKKKHPTWATKYRESGKELRLLNGRYYLYEISSRYDPERKRTVKVTGKILGRITKDDGLIESDKRKLAQVKEVSHYEYGVSQFILNQSVYLKRLEQHFPDDWKAIVLAAYARLCRQAPIKRMGDYTNRSWLSKELDLQLSTKSIPVLLQKIGAHQTARTEYLTSFVSKQDYLLIDCTDIKTSASDSMLSKAGYSSDMSWGQQSSLLYLYSRNLQQPVYYRLLPGNIRDVKAFSLSLKEAQIEDATIIADRGFFSEDNIAQLLGDNLSFVIPLKRSHSLVDYKELGTNKDYFKRHNSYVWFKKTRSDRGFYVYLFLNTDLKVQEEKDYLSRIESHPDEYSYDEFAKKSDSFGTLAIASNLDSEPAQIYELYKTRLDIEQTFDTLKHILKADSPYMHNDNSLQGWMFINHIALQWCYEISSQIKAKKLSAKISIKDAIERLFEVRKIKINNAWYSAEKTKNEDLIASLLLA